MKEPRGPPDAQNRTRLGRHGPFCRRAAVAGDEVQGQPTGCGVVGAGGVVAHHRPRFGKDRPVRAERGPDRRLPLGDREDLHMVVETQGDEAFQILAPQHDAAVGRGQVLDRDDRQCAELQLVPHPAGNAKRVSHARSTFSAASVRMAAMAWIWTSVRAVSPVSRPWMVVRRRAMAS